MQQNLLQNQQIMKALIISKSSALVKISLFESLKSKIDPRIGFSVKFYPDKCIYSKNYILKC